MNLISQIEKRLTINNTSKEDSMDKLELYDELIAAYPDIDGNGKTIPYTSHNGHMFIHTLEY